MASSLEWTWQKKRISKFDYKSIGNATTEMLTNKKKGALNIQQLWHSLKE